MKSWRKGKFGAVVLVFQVAFLILFGILAEYDHDASASDEANQKDPEHGGAHPGHNRVKDYYPMFQDVHVMIFIGFGFLMTFLKRYGYGSVGLNMVIAAFVIQWSIIFSGFLDIEGGKIHINITKMLTADFAAAAVLITFGALLGKTSPVQMIFVAFIEIIFFHINEYIGIKYLKAVDVGGSMFVHAFGAYFGLACARVLYNKEMDDHQNEGSNYHSDLFSMIGTVFLWLYWPSFNSALAPGDDQHRAVINTYLALCACAVAAFAVSSLVSHEDKFDMVHVQNATLAGGVAVGTSADMMIHPWGAILIGMLAGTLSVVGFKYLQPLLHSKLKIHDTCGVNNLHGMPGILAGLIGAIVASAASLDAYGYSLYEIFPARAPSGDNSTALADIQSHLADVEAGDGRTASTQAGYQVVALVVTLVFAIVTGAITGLLLKIDLWNQPKGGEIMDDGPWWETPEDFQAYEAVAETNGNTTKMDKLLETTADESKVENADV